jgi:RNA polymerase sigma-70 factor, ECF subfamily
VSIHGGATSQTTTTALAAQLVGNLTRASEEAVRLELKHRLQEALNAMDPLDREVLALKHFEQLSTSEIAEVLGLSKAGAGSRYLRAIKRLREILERMPGFNEL